MDPLFPRPTDNLSTIFPELALLSAPPPVVMPVDIHTVHAPIVREKSLRSKLVKLENNPRALKLIYDYARERKGKFSKLETEINTVTQISASSLKKYVTGMRHIYSGGKTSAKSCSEAHLRVARVAMSLFLEDRKALPEAKRRRMTFSSKY